MRIGLIGAMPEEVSLMEKYVKNLTRTNIGKRDYISGNLFGIDTVLIISRCGKVSSASTVTTLINHFNVDYVIFTGVAGAIASKLNVGDIVISENAYQHDMDASPLFPKHEIPLLNQTFFASDENLLQHAKIATDLFVKNDLHNLIQIDTLQKFSISNPKIYTGTIASGDQFISDTNTIKNLIDAVPDTLSVEMEGAAVGQVCFEHNVPFIIIRTISDKADHSAAIDFGKFISEVANYYSLGIIKNLYHSLSN